jgi:hypothetical protein
MKNNSTKKTIATCGVQLTITTRLVEYSERNTKTRMYFFDDRVQETVGEQLVNRRSRPFAEYRKMLPAIFEAFKLPQLTAKWSQRAGCNMCPCSPGFVLDGHRGAEFYISILDADADAS